MIYKVGLQCCWQHRLWKKMVWTSESWRIQPNVKDLDSLQNPALSQKGSAGGLDSLLPRKTGDGTPVALAKSGAPQKV